MIISKNLYRKVLVSVLVVALLLALILTLNLQPVLSDNGLGECVWYDDYGQCFLWIDADPVIPSHIPTLFGIPPTSTPSG